MANENTDKIRALHEQITALKSELTDLLKVHSPVHDYTFDSADGPRTLSSLFGRHEDLFVIHNMGKSCPYCMLWADGFNGVAGHLQNRAAVAITSPDSVTEQQNLSTSRHWTLPMYSLGDSSFAKDMGYQNEQGYHPGVSVFQRSGDTITRVATSPFGPGDDYCAIWHLLNLLPDGANGWQPKFSY